MPRHRVARPSLWQEKKCTSFWVSCLRLDRLRSPPSASPDPRSRAEPSAPPDYKGSSAMTTEPDGSLISKNETQIAEAHDGTGGAASKVARLKSIRISGSPRSEESSTLVAMRIPEIFLM